MYHIHGFKFATNSFKPIAVLEELGCEYKFDVLDPQKGEHKTEDHLKRHLLGKVPTLSHNGQTLFESGAICKYIAKNEGSSLYPSSIYESCLVDQWMDFFSIHLGRWINALYFEKVIKKKIEQKVNESAVAEATEFAVIQSKALNKHLGENQYLCGSNLTIADFFAYSYLRQQQNVDLDLSEFRDLNSWSKSISLLDSTKRTESQFMD